MTMTPEERLSRVADLALKRLESLLETEEPLDSQELKRIVSTLKELWELSPLPDKPEQPEQLGLRIVLEGELEAFSG